MADTTGKNFRDEDFYKYFSRLYTDITLNNKAPWMQEGVPERGLAYNPKSGVIFKGVNSIVLEMKAAQKGYKDSRWLTTDEINKLGIKVKDGEIGTPIAYVNKYSPPVDVHPGTGEKFSQTSPRQRYYFMYNVEQLKNCELARDAQFIVGENVINQKVLNAIENAKTNDLKQMTHTLISSTVKSVPKEMAAIAAGITQYRLSQEFHVPYKPVLNTEQLDSFKTTKTTTDNLLRTVYQCEVTKDRLLSSGQELENGITRSVERSNTKQNQRTVHGAERD